MTVQAEVEADVVRRVVGLFSPRRKPAPLTPRLCAPYMEFIAETLARYPRLRASRLFDTLREHVARVRPQPLREAFLRTEVLIGEQAQVDWAHVGSVKVEGGQRSLWAFVLVLSWSRAMWAELVFDLTAQSLCRSLVQPPSPWAAARGSGSSTIPRRWCWSGTARPPDFIPHWSSSPPACTCSRASARCEG